MDEPIPKPPVVRKRALTGGETTRQYIARVLEEQPYQIRCGRLYVDEIAISPTGKPYRKVSLELKDIRGELCLIQKTYWAGQLYHADAFVPWHDHTTQVLVVGLNEEEVEVKPKETGRGVIYVYKCHDIFLSPLTALRATDLVKALSLEEFWDMYTKRPRLPPDFTCDPADLEAEGL